MTNSEARHFRDLGFWLFLFCGAMHIPRIQQHTFLFLVITLFSMLFKIKELKFKSKNGVN